MRFFIILYMLFFSFLSLFPEEDKEEAPVEIGYERYLGFSIEEAYKQFGSPDEVSVFRGEEAWQDDVIFFYEDFLSLFWYENRVWQIRLDHRYDSEVYGLGMGIEKKPAAVILGEKFGDPIFLDAISLIYRLPAGNIDYPVYVRFVFTEDRLSDLYIYRGDF